MKKTEKELLLQQRIALHHIERYAKENMLDAIGEYFPGFLHFNRKDDLHIQYMNPSGLTKYGVTLEYIQNNGAEFLENYVHPQTRAEIFPRFIDFYNRNDSGRTYADCQDIVNPTRSKKYYQILTVTKVVKELNGLMSMSLPVHELGPNLGKIKGLVKIDEAFEKKFERFQSLSNREKEVLKWVALGLTNKEIADKLVLSEHTVRTHRNHIFAKSGIHHLREAIHIAEVFGLI